MRLNVSHGFLRSNCSPLFFGFVDSHVAKLHQHFSRQVKPERFLVLLNKQLKHINKSRTPAVVGLSSDTENPVTVVVAATPAWKVPFLLRGYNIHEGKTSNHRAFIWIVGLAISLVSLSAIRVFELFDWLSKVTLGKDTEVFELDGRLDSPGVNLIPWCPEWSTPSRSPEFPTGYFASPRHGIPSSPTPRTGYASTTFHGVSRAPAHSGNQTRLNEPVDDNGTMTPMPEIDPLAPLFSRSPLESLDASLNCPHFSQGTNQLCVICWLNNPDLWVFGPVLSSLDRSILSCLDRLANLTKKVASRPHPVVGLAAASTLLHRPVEVQKDLHSGLASPAATAWPNVVTRNGADLNATPLQPCSHRKRLLSSERLEHLSSIQPTPKIARSSGDGAPAASPADAYSSSVSKVPVSKGPPEASTQSPGRPKFYTSDSDAELTPHSSVDPHRPDFPSPEQLRVSASRVIYKALELLGSKSPECPSNPHFAGGTSSLVTSPEARRVGPWNSAYQTQSIGSDKSGRSHGSVRSFNSDQFEYDELHMSPSLNPHLGNYSSSFNALDPEEDERLQREEEAQLMRLLSTLTSLLEKVDHMSSGNPLSPDAGTDGNSCDASSQSPTSVAAGRTKKNVPFTDLFQSASDITEDLQSLEEVLDKLRYKLQANQIELEQVEDKLDYAWHLHENLDGPLADSLSSSSLASLNSEPGPRYPSTINPTVTLPSPLFLEVGVTEPRASTDPAAGPVSTSPHLLGATDIAVTDSLLTSYTSSYTSSSAEPDRLFLSMTDSACGRSIRSPQTMVLSVPDAGSLIDDSNQLESVYPNCATLDRPRPGRMRSRSKQLCTSFRRSTFHTDRSYQVVEHEPTSDYEESVDPDGFLHPEMTFDKDGGIDWSESNDALR